MDAVLHRFGLLGCRMEWASEFPLSLFLKIKDIAAGKNALSRSVVIPPEQDFGAEAAGSDFAAECELIQTISQ